MKRVAFISLLSLAFALGGCGGGQATRGGGYYLDDGPGRHVPSNLDKIPDAVPKAEPLKTGTMRPYTVMGKTYTPMTALRSYKTRGIASWYGKKFDGEKTASGEIYDMYKMTAASPVLPIPSYARVTNLENGKSVIVRINDRGPFLSDRVMDLSYAAAYKLDLVRKGSGRVEIETIIPGESLPPPPVVVASAPASAPAAASMPASTTTTSSSHVGAPVTALAPTVPTVAAPVMPASSTSTTSTPTTITTTPEASTDATSDAAFNTANAPNAVSDSAPEIVEEREPQGVFLQLGAFGSQDNAEHYAEQLRTQANWLASAVQVYSKNDGLYRVHAGPFADPTEAKQVADKLNQSLGIQAIVVTR